ncbi:hypothetical protein N9224_00120 [Akkermansiaceae bacterium]|nr:hypothetical protein [Akkermansiaceae bacterium]MDB4507985.1 hypothetical protein [Akkermansiaceae bacterium]MDB4541663.1 hypothetical protein [Akkermansiaceae bacterium]
MKIFLITAFLGCLISSLGAVDPPKTYPANRYYSLWQNSPVTDKPLPPPIDEVNDLEDWVLVGLEEYTTGKVVTIVNKKDPSQRLRVPGPLDASKEFTVLEVKKGEGSFMDTTVILQKGKNRGEVSFDSKYLVLRKAPPRKATKKPTTKPSSSRKTPAPTPTPKGLPGGATPAKSPTTTTNAPRRRYIPKPTK